jgi:hypothetical protein
MRALLGKVERSAMEIAGRCAWLLGAAALAAASPSCTSSVVAGTGGMGGTGTSSVTSTGSTGSASSASSTSSSGTGGQSDCASAADCPAAPNACVVASCMGGICGTVNVPQMVLMKDTPADCKDTVCDGNGNVTTAIDQGNVPASSNACLEGTCDAMGNPGTTPAAAGTICSTANGKLCDGTGDCVQCLHASDCPPDAMCTPAHTCSAAVSCVDEVQDGTETDVDCGGGACPPCAVGQKCKVGADCTSSACDALTLTCVADPCDDQVRDGTETDVDCGGGICPSCTLGKSCKVDSDCTTNACDALTLTCVANQCNDQVQDGSETDIDCGGGTCAPCANGKKCNLGADCVTDTCSSHVCM